MSWQEINAALGQVLLLLSSISFASTRLVIYHKIQANGIVASFYCQWEVFQRSQKVLGTHLQIIKFIASFAQLEITEFSIIYTLTIVSRFFRNAISTSRCCLCLDTHKYSIVGDWVLIIVSIIVGTRLVCWPNWPCTSIPIQSLWTYHKQYCCCLC